MYIYHVYICKWLSRSGHMHGQPLSGRGFQISNPMGQAPKNADAPAAPPRIFASTTHLYAYIYTAGSARRRQGDINIEIKTTSRWPVQ